MSRLTARQAWTGTEVQIGRIVDNDDLLDVPEGAMPSPPSWEVLAIITIAEAKALLSDLQAIDQAHVGHTRPASE